MTLLVPGASQIVRLLPSSEAKQCMFSPLVQVPPPYKGALQACQDFGNPPAGQMMHCVPGVFWPYLGGADPCQVVTAPSQPVPVQPSVYDQ